MAKQVHLPMHAQQALSEDEEKTPEKKETPEERIERLERIAEAQQRRREEKAAALYSNFVPDASQLAAVEKIVAWVLDDEHPEDNVRYLPTEEFSPEMRTLVGAAGTGKTSLIPLIIKRLGWKVYTCRELVGGIRIMAYTNRARIRLEEKGLGARTVHGFAGHAPPELPNDPKIIAAYEELKQKVVEAQDAAPAFLRAAEKEMDKFLALHRNRDEDQEFALDPDSILSRTKLVIGDEMSMLNRQQGEIIRKQCRKLLILGDPLQLGPPTTEGSYFLPYGGTWDYELSTIHRQGAGKLADFLEGLRERRDVQFARYADDRFEPDVYVYRGIEPHVEALRMADVAIARDHGTVWELNQQMRAAKGLAGKKGPHAGERLISLYQNPNRHLSKNDFVTFVEDPVFNKELKLAVGRIETEDGYPICQHDVFTKKMLTTADGEPLKQSVLPEYFLMHPGRTKRFEWAKMEGAAKFDGRWSNVLKLAFGHAISVYQSQGGEWDVVLVRFRSFWRRTATPEEQAKIAEDDFRALYTACSRARKRVFIYM